MEAVPCGADMILKTPVTTETSIQQSLVLTDGGGPGEVTLPLWQGESEGGGPG